MICSSTKGSDEADVECGLRRFSKCRMPVVVIVIVVTTRKRLAKP